GALGRRPGVSEGRRKNIHRQEYRSGDRIRRIGGARLLDDVVGAVEQVMPRAAVPVIGPDEIEDARTLGIQRYVAVFGVLTEKMARVCGLIAAGAVIGAAHVRALADPNRR